MRQAWMEVVDGEYQDDQVRRTAATSREHFFNTNPELLGNSLPTT